MAPYAKTQYLKIVGILRVATALVYSKQCAASSGEVSIDEILYS